MKPKRASNKIISVLLTLIMLIGMLPLSIIPTQAASFNPSPNWGSVSNKNGNYVGLSVLQTFLRQPDTQYLKLTSNLKYVGDDDYKLNITVKGVKHLDLNGHALVYGVDRIGDSWRHPFITVEEGAELYIYDSAGKGSYIHYEGKLTKNDDEIFRHIIYVKEGGKLVVNGGTIEAGRSKQIYGSWEEDVYPGKDADTFTGNIRHQIIGSAIILEKNSSCIINGGRFYGRGYTRSAIAAGENANLVINDAYIQGSGCAHGINVNDGANLTIRRVEIDTKKVDRYASFGTYHTDTFLYGKYGLAILGGDVSTFVVGNVDISKSDPSGKDVFGDRVHQYATVKPAETPANVGLQLQDPGWSTFSTDTTNLVTAAERRVSIKDDFTPHYSGYESELFQDYNNNTDYTILSEWQIFDKNGKTAVSNHQSSQASSYAGLEKSIDMRQFKAVNGTDALKLTNGELYVLRLTVYEIWRGYTTQMAITRTAEMNFGAAPDLSGLDFGISAQQERSGTSFSVKVTPSETNGVLPYLLNRSITYGYELPNSSAGNVLMEERRYSSTFDTVSFGNLPTGKQTIVARLQGNDAFGFKQEFTARQNIFVMPRIKLGLPSGQWTYSLQAGDTYDTISYHEHRLRAVSSEELASAGLTGSAISWEMWNSTQGKWVNANSGISGVSKMSTGELKLTDGRSGAYRAKVYYNGQWWYSPQAFTFVGKDYGSTHKITATVDRTEMENTKANSATVSIMPNFDGADWGKRWHASLIIYEGNVPAEAYEKFRNHSSAQILPDGGIRISFPATKFTKNKDASVQKLNTWSIFILQGDKIPTGKYTFVPYAEVEDTNYSVKGTPFTITVNKRITGMDITADGQNATNGKGTTVDDAPKVVMDTSTNKMRLNKIYTPIDANLPNKNVTTTWSSSNTNIATVDSSGVVTAKRPGTVTITMTHKGKIGTEEVSYTRYLKVVVPIAEVQFSGPDWYKQLGKTYKDVQLNITKVRCTNGEWLDGSTYLTSKLISKGTRDGSNTSVGSVYNDKVAYNDNYRIYYELTPKKGYQFQLKEATVSGDYYITNDMKLKITRVDSTDMNTAANQGYFALNYNGHYYVPKYDTEEAYQAHNCGISITEDLPCLRDPSAVYIDTVAVETDEPKEGDLRYGGEIPESDDELQKIGTAYHPINMNNARIITLMGEKAADGHDLIRLYRSTNYKLNTPLVGGGTPFTPLAEGEASNSNYGSEYFNVLYETDADGMKISRTKLENTRYEAATYAHSLRLLAGNTGQDGKTYYFAPDVKLIINGREVQLIDQNGTSSGYSDASDITATYYVTADPRPAFVNGTVSGLTAPTTDETPATTDDLTVIGTDSKGVTTDKMYASGLVWFIDKNGNGKWDESETCTAGNGLADDGKFLGGKDYSAYVMLSAEAEDGRIDNTAFTLKLSDVATPLSTTEAKGAYKFPKTQYIPPVLKLTDTGTQLGAKIDKALGTENFAGFVYGVDTLKTGTKLADCLTAELGLVEVTANANGVLSTGASILLKDKEKKVYETYSYVYFGDINGDGAIDAFDAFAIDKSVNNHSTLGDASAVAADVNADGEITIADISLIMTAAVSSEDVISQAR